jgi:hypothetical protein
MTQKRSWRESQPAPPQSLVREMAELSKAQEAHEAAGGSSRTGPLFLTPGRYVLRVGSSTRAVGESSYGESSYKGTLRFRQTHVFQ